MRALLIGVVIVAVFAITGCRPNNDYGTCVEQETRRDSNRGTGYEPGTTHNNPFYVTPQARCLD